MLLAFKEIRKYISPAILSGVVLCVMLFDILATIGAYGLWMLVNDTLQVDTIFIVSVLTVIAYGINDVIVIFDRIRENMTRNTKAIPVRVNAYRLEPENFFLGFFIILL